MMRVAPFSLLVGLSLCAQPTVAIDGSCGADTPSKVSDCQNEDCGSCGGACCEVSFEVSESTLRAADLLNFSITSGGPDRAYTARVTAEGPLGFGDLRPFKKPVDFIGQAYHTTSGPKHYQDSVSFTVAPSAGGSVVKAFSMSLTAGAFCDNGQNYKNIKMLMEGISWARGYKEVRTGSSCPRTPGLGDRAGGGACTDADAKIWEAGAKSSMNQWMGDCITKGPPGGDWKTHCIRAFGNSSDKDAGRRCMADCVQKREGFSAECSACFGALSQCTFQNCAMKCLDPKAKMCKDCILQAGCMPTFKACSGIEDMPNATAMTGAHLQLHV